MSFEGDLRRIMHEIAACPHCGQRHVFPVLVRVRTAEAVKVPLFGGPPVASTLAFTCPTTGKIISEAVYPPPGGDMIGPADDAAPVAPEPIPALASSPSLDEQEYADWIKASRATAVDFCKTMLTAATGAVPVYFAVLKYLGSDAGGSWSARIRALPPLLFLAAVIVFSLAIRPHFATIEKADFSEFRATRLQRLNIAMLAGLTLFATGILVAIALGVAALGS
jgi:hypothetical protein